MDIESYIQEAIFGENEQHTCFYQLIWDTFKESGFVITDEDGHEIDAIFKATAIQNLLGEFMYRLYDEVNETGFEDVIDYMIIGLACEFFQALSLTLYASLRSANKAVYPRLVTVVVNVLNIIGNYSLIFGRFGFPELGVEGAAISTAFSRGVSMVILLVI